MKGRATIAGHPIHQIMIPLPLGALIVATVFDVIVAFGGPTELSIAAFWSMVAGVLSGLAAAVFGVLDWTKIPEGTRAKRIGVVHAAVNVVAIALFAVAIGLRYDEPSYVASALPLALELGAFAFAGLGGYFGGELVVRHAIGILEDAGPDASPKRSTGHDARRSAHGVEPRFGAAKEQLS